VDDESRYPRSVAPSNTSRSVESLDGNGNEEGDTARKAARARSVIDVNDESSDEGQVAEETDEAERSMI